MTRDLSIRVQFFSKFEWNNRAIPHCTMVPLKNALTKKGSSFFKSLILQLLQVQEDKELCYRSIPSFSPNAIQWSLESNATECESFHTYSLHLHPSSTWWFAEKLHVVLLLLLKCTLRWMIANQTWPPRMTLEFGPHNVIKLNFSRTGFFVLSRCLPVYSCFVLVNGRKAFCSFFRGIAFIFVWYFAADWRRWFLDFWCFVEVREKGRHTCFIRDNQANFPAFFKTRCASAKWGSTSCRAII